MCGGGSYTPPPPPPPPDPAIEERANAARQRERRIANNQATQLKQDLFEQRVAKYASKFGGRSLLTGSKGGSGFSLNQEMLSRKTLGA